jgi:glycerol-3-phosphate acyltransferase PlsY
MILFSNPVLTMLIPPCLAYLAGSIPFGVIIAKAHGVDLRQAGSGNVGATNVARVLGKPWGYLCFVLDVAKGFLPCLAIVMLTHPQQGQPPEIPQQVLWLLTGMGAILGHVFNIWLKFRGGKGVATALGVVLGIWPYFTYAGLVTFGLWIVVTLISRYVSLGSIVAALAFLPLVVCLHFQHAAQLWPLETFAAVMAALIIIRHRANISRLLHGTENKIGVKKAAS